MDYISNYLNAHGIRPSAQRLKVFEYLHKSHSHPTVDEIHQSLLPSMPSLSKTTIYNTLKLFVSCGVAVAVNIEDNEVRYDSNTAMHGHFKCIGCGAVYDFPFDREQVKLNQPNTFQIKEYHINLKGYCQVCQV